MASQLECDVVDTCIRYKRARAPLGSSDQLLVSGCWLVGTGWLLSGNCLAACLVHEDTDGVAEPEERVVGGEYGGW